MKKLLVVLLALTVIASFASAADVTMGTWSRIGMMTYQQVGSADAVTQDYPSWGRVAVSFAAKTDNFGMAADAEFHPESGTVAIGDTAKLWAKLFDGKITISAGKGYFDTLRGKIGGAQSVGVMYGGDEDAIFKRFQTKGGGLMLELAPVDGLYIGADIIGPGSSSTQLASVTYRDIRVGAGYTIEGIGLVRAQYRGDGYATKVVQAAFAFTGVEGLTVDAGMEFYVEGSAQNFISAAAKYSANGLGAMARTKVLLPKDSAKLDVGLGANVNYKVADGYTVGADVGLSSILETGKIFAATPYLQINPEGGGTIQLGFQCKMMLDGTKDFTYGIPLTLTF